MSWLYQPSAGTELTPFDLSDRGLLLSDGVFTTALVVDGQVAFRDQHVARLIGDAAFIGIDLEQEALETAIDARVTDSALSALRVTVTRGCGPRGLTPFESSDPTLIVSCRPIDPTIARDPARLVLSHIRRNETSPTSRRKTLAYLDSILALKGARALGFDDALFLNSKGDMTCATAANIFCTFGTELVTPPVEDGVLAGVTRAFILEVAPELGLQPQIRSISRADILAADRVFLTNSLRGIVPVAEIEGTTFDPEVPSGLLGAWEAAVGLKGGVGRG